MTITGPYSKVVTSNAIRHERRTWYRQTPPYRKRLNFEYSLCVLTDWYNQTAKDSNNPGNQSYNPLDNSPAYNLALNQAYDKFKAKVASWAEIAPDGSKETHGGFAQIASSLGEGRQAVDMMQKRLMQMARFVTALRKGDVSSAGKALGVGFKRAQSNAYRSRQWQEYWRRARNSRNETKGMKPVSDTFTEAFESFGGSANYRTKWPRKPKPGTREFGEWFADTFLEFHFGWAPLVKDIGDGIEVLQSTFPPYTVRARGASAMTQGKPKQYVNDPLNGRVTWWRSRVQIIANVVITNPQLWRANQLGFVNPISWLWEWTPFSFVVDWFTNVGSFLSQYTDFLGLDIQEPAVTHSLEHRETVDFWSYYAQGVWSVKQWYCMRRTPGLLKPALAIKSFRGFSVTRGVTAISLILQQFKGIK